MQMQALGVPLTDYHKFVRLPSDIVEMWGIVATAFADVRRSQQERS